MELRAAVARPMLVRPVWARGGALETFRWSRAAGHPLVAVHGYLDHGRSWDGFVPALGGMFELVSFSARGHGRSDHADAYQWADFVADLVTVLGSFPDRPVDVIAHSWGAHLAMDAALLAPGLIRRLVNVDGLEADHPPAATPDLLERIRRSADRPLPPTRDGFSSLAELTTRRQELTPRVPPEVVASFVRHGSRVMDGRWHWSLDPILVSGTMPWDARKRRPLDLAEAIAAVTIDILLITGGVEESRHLTPRRELAWQAATRHDHVRHVHVADAGHYVHLERPDVVAAAVRNFLR